MWGRGEGGAEGRTFQVGRYSARAGVGRGGVGVEARTHPCGSSEGGTPRAREHMGARARRREGLREGGDSGGRWAHASPRAGEAHALGARGGRAHRHTRRGVEVCATARAERVGCLIKRIFGTKAEPQRIVATRPLCRVQHPVPHSSRLQGIHRGGPVTCDRVRLRPKLGVLAAERPSR